VSARRRTASAARKRKAAPARRRPAEAREPERARVARKPERPPAARKAARTSAGGAEAPAPRARGPVVALSHIAIATPDADALARTLIAALGAERGEEEMLDDGELRVLFVRLGPVILELLEPRSVHHTVARFIGKRGSGLHHVSLDVENIEGVLARCRAAGVPLIDESPRAGAHGNRVAFLHPKGLGGVLVELCERHRH
jgi:methylmalonyl-CoA/ethylmalonyl-CoA epimerase